LLPKPSWQKTNCTSIFEKTTKRRYVALVWGDLDNDEGTIIGHIGRSPKNRQVFTVFPDGGWETRRNSL
jgi:23S rRNA-/tRNA-specific pseudouridylate synthase